MNDIEKAKRVYEYTKALSGIKEKEWMIVQSIIDNNFESQKRELESDLELPTTDFARNAIHSRFGQILD